MQIEQVTKDFSKNLLDLNAQLLIILHQDPFDSTTKEQDQIILQHENEEFDSERVRAPTSSDPLNT